MQNNDYPGNNIMKNSLCNNPDCEYNPGFICPHYHVQTNNGNYVKYIVEKPKPIKEINEISDIT